MSRIHLIINVIDEDLLKRRKSFMSLGAANKLIYEQGIISETEKNNGYLKYLLVNKEIPNASQTEKAPKQWRVFLSPDAIKTEKASQRKPPSRPSRAGKGDVRLAQMEPVNSKKNNGNFNKWILAGGVALVLLVGLLTSDGSSNNSIYNITTTTYVATNKSDFDEMFLYFRDNDEAALRQMIFAGRVRLLEAGTEVSLINNHFSYSVVREIGSSQKLWVVTDHLGK